MSTSSRINKNKGAKIMLNIITGRTGSGKTRLIRSKATEIANVQSGKAIIIVP